MLVIVTTAEQRFIKASLGEALRSFRPDIPQHRFVGSFDKAQPLPGDHVLVCGAKMVDLAKKAGIFAKQPTVMTLREKIVTKEGVTYQATVDPTVISSQPAMKDVIQWDVRLAVRFMRYGTTKPHVGEYRYVPDFADLIARVKEKHAETKKPVDVTVDTETMGFFPWSDDKDIVSISFTVDKGTADVLYLGPKFPSPVPLSGADIHAQIEWLLTSPIVKIRASNGKYDFVWIAVKWGVECTNFKFDNMLVGSLLNENRENSLNAHAKFLTDMGGYDDAFNAKYDKGKMETIPPGEDFLVYAGGDTDAAHQVADVLRVDLVEQGKLAKFYTTILHPAARAFEKIERRGVLIDQERMQAVRARTIQVADAREKEMFDLLPKLLVTKHRDKIKACREDGKSPLVNGLLMDFFFSPAGLNLKPRVLTEKTQQPSLKKSHLEMFHEVPEAKAFVAAFTEYNRANKTRATFVDGFLNSLRPDGCLHPTYFLGHAEFEEGDDDEAGTVTGRLSAKNPAFQTLPKKKPKVGENWAGQLRSCYIAPPGKVILEVDYSQGELKVVACVAGESNMLDAYHKGLDLHAVTGAALSQTPLEEFLTWKNANDPEKVALYEKYRGDAKPANFGLLYGMGAEGFQRYAWATYGLAISLETAEFMREQFFKLYPGLLDYHDYQRSFAHRHGCVVSPLGRIRHLDAIHSFDRSVRSKAERQAINSPIQSCLNDMMLWTLAELEALHGDNIGVFGVIHDAFVAYVDEDYVENRVLQIKEVMENLPLEKLEWTPELKFTCDAKAGPDLAHLSEVKLAA